MYDSMSYSPRMPEHTIIEKELWKLLTTVPHGFS
jgi:hypothetical protein